MPRLGFILLLILPALTTRSGLAQSEGDILNRNITINAIVNHDGWGNNLRGPSSAFFDHKALELFVTDAGNNRVVVYDETLHPKFSFKHFVPSRRTGEMIPGEPSRLVVNSHGEIFVIDNIVDFIDVLDYRGTAIDRIHLDSLLGDTSIQIKPQAIAVDANDRLYVASTGDISALFILNDHFDLIRVIDNESADIPLFKSLMALTVFEDKIYTTDLHAVPAMKVFDTSGAYLYGFGAHDIERSDVSFPSAIDVMKSANGKITIWVVDGLRQVVKVYHHDGEFLAHVGGFGYKPGEFQYPSGIAAYGDTVVFISERAGNRIQRLRINRD